MIDLPLTSNWIQIGSRQTCWRDMPHLALPPRSVVAADSHEQALLAVAAHVRDPQELAIVPTGRLDEELISEFRDQGFSIVQDLGISSHRAVPQSSTQPENPGIWLLTSGSTGRPKRVHHTVASLTTVTSGQPSRTWLCAYAPGSYAWWQVVTLGLSHSSTNIVFVDAQQIDNWPEVALASGVNAVSGTPTFWRHALWRNSQGVANIPLEQVTLGGEPVDQGILDALSHLHPRARITWIYASSEAGAAIAVHDGRAGFPVEWLDRKVPNRPVISVDGEELVLSSPHASQGNANRLRTGDRVEIEDGRVRIVGRLNSDEVNVGGSKVSVSAVRDTLMQHPGVVWARAHGRSAPIVGHVVVAELVLQPGTTEAELKTFCAERLPDHAVPRRFKILDGVPLTESLKSRV